MSYLKQWREGKFSPFSPQFPTKVEYPKIKITSHHTLYVKCDENEKGNRKMNRIILVGRLTKDPELRYTQNGEAVATFTLAVNRTFTNQQGEREADFINCVLWRKLAENAANFLSKGSLCGVDGRIQTRNYEGQDGKRVYVTEVLAESVRFLESKKQSNDSTSGDQQKSNNVPFENGGQIDVSDDDLPF